MRTFIGLTGATIGGSVGWWLGNKVGLGTAIIVSAVGSGAGLYAFKRLLRDYIGG
ncbi:MAG: hypothetical protein ACE5GY_01640 [Thermodesulfobacteriota bacterium]